MKKLNHEEITAKRNTLETLHLVKKMPVYVLLNSIRSNYNVGSIFRTSDGAMIEKLYLCGYTPYPPKKEILKTALGSTESVCWEYVKEPEEVVLKLKEQGVKICALEITENSRDYSDILPADFPLCLIVGNEITGVSQNLIDLCDFTLEIPQYGIKHSLNVGVAYGISLFEIRKAYEKNKH
jgi:tRNA G18 (ribose-2'-O)-methylase SpoU